MPRFVVLEHDSPQQGRHWDFMLEHEGTLATWALPAVPHCLLEPTGAERLPDHRLAYLEYEGPISGGRGSVVRYDAGTYLGESFSDSQWIVVLRGGRLCGRAVLKCTSPDGSRWTFCFEPE